MLTAEHAETAEKPPRKSNPVTQAFQPVHNAGRNGPPTKPGHGAGSPPPTTLDRWHRLSSLCMFKVEVIHEELKRLDRWHRLSSLRITRAETARLQHRDTGQGPTPPTTLDRWHRLSSLCRRRAEVR